MWSGYIYSLDYDLILVDFDAKTRMSNLWAADVAQCWRWAKTNDSSTFIAQ